MLRLIYDRNQMDSHRTTLILVIALSLTACSTARVSNDNGADLGSIQPGATRDKVEQILGEPLRKWTLPGGVTYRVYQYSTERVRIPVARNLWYRVAQTAVSYDENDIVLGTFPDFHVFDELPSDGHSKMVVRK